MNKRERDFVATVWRFYEDSGRHDLPWRQTRDPYHILVSEVMLQQTQVERVAVKYQVFLERFPTFAALAAAPLSDVLILWQGLGYNRRAKMLHECAKVVVREYSGQLPQDEATLRTLPGIGPYTARAVLAFAFDTAEPLIETNIRTVYIEHFFKNATGVADAELLPHIRATLDRANPREWYYALMDYGSYLKRTVGNNISRSRHYIRQSTFFGSDRQIRGAILRHLVAGRMTRATLVQALGQFDTLRLDEQLQKLCAEGMIMKSGRSYQLPS